MSSPLAAAPELEAWRLELDRARSTRTAEPAWLRDRREAARARFLERGFPGPKDEAWRFTSVAPLARQRFEPPPRVERAALSPFATHPLFDGHRIVLLNGRFAPALSSLAPEDGVEVLGLREALALRGDAMEAHLGGYAGEDGSPFPALSTALFEDGAFVSVRAGAVVSRPIHVVHYATSGAPAAVHPRTLINVARNAQATVVETFGGQDGDLYWTNAVTEVALEDGAVLDHYTLQQESERAFHVSTLAVRQGRASRFGDTALLFGAALARREVNQVFAGEGGECALDGLFLVGGAQHTDVHTRIDHAEPHCASRELYKGILEGRARGVFHGTILVRQGAQKTDAWQVNKNLLLSREALVNSTPALEIFADDVKCKHGSTTGQLDPAALFYLRSRGIGAEAARALLTYAFASDLVSRIRVEPLRAGLERHLQARLPAAAEVREAVA